jgi:hypothetical protein
VIRWRCKPSPAPDPRPRDDGPAWTNAPEPRRPRRVARWHACGRVTFRSTADNRPSSGLQNNTCRRLVSPNARRRASTSIDNVVRRPAQSPFNDALFATFRGACSELLLRLRCTDTYQHRSSPAAWSARRRCGPLRVASEVFEQRCEDRRTPQLTESGPCGRCCSHRTRRR